MIQNTSTCCQASLRQGACRPCALDGDGDGRCSVHSRHVPAILRQVPLCARGGPRRQVHERGVRAFAKTRHEHMLLAQEHVLVPRRRLGLPPEQPLRSGLACLVCTVYKGCC